MTYNTWPLLVLIVALVLLIIIATQLHRPVNVSSPMNRLGAATVPWLRPFTSLQNYSLDDLLAAAETSSAKIHRRNRTLQLNAAFVGDSSMDELVDRLRAYDQVWCSHWQWAALAQLAGCQDIYVHGQRVVFQAPEIVAAAPWYFHHNYHVISTWEWNGAEFIIINLARHETRLRAMHKQFQLNAARTYQRFPAIEGAHWVQQMKVQWRSPTAFSGGRLGIYLSSLEIYARLVQTGTNIQYFTILEDDVSFAQETIPDPAHIVGLAPRDWDIIFLGLNRRMCVRFEHTPFLRLTSRCMPGAFAYIIRKRMARYLLQQAWPMTMPLDNLFQRLANHFCLYAPAVDWAQADYNVISSTQT